AARAAVDEFVKSGDIVGIGSGSTVVYAAERLGERIKEEGLVIKCIPSSFQASQLIAQHGLNLTNFDTNPVIDIAIDGADEVDTQLNCIKGGGGCHLQEKIVISNAKKFVIVADYRKESSFLGENWTQGVPIEVVPLAYTPIMLKLRELNGTPVLRMAKAKAGPVITDNGNFILDTNFGVIEDPACLCQTIKLLPGVVEVGLFCNMASKAFFGQADGSVKSFIFLLDKITMHHMSDHLSDRYPYTSGFREENYPYQVSRAYGNGDIDRYCWLLSPSEHKNLSEKDRIEALQQLAQLLSSAEKKSKAIAANIIPSASRLLTFDDPLVKAETAKVIAAVAWDRDGAVAIQADPTLLFNLNNLLVEHDDAVVEEALEALVNLTSSKDGIAMVLARHYLPERLVLMASRLPPSVDINEPPVELSARAVRLLFYTFSNLTKATLGAEICTSCHIVPALLKIVKRPLHYQVPVLRSAVLTLWNLGTHNYGKIEAIGSNAVELTTKVLIGIQKGAIKCDQEDVQDLYRCLSGALMSMATAEEAIPKLLSVAIEPLVHCLYEPEAVKNAIQAMNYIAEDPCGLVPMVTLLLKDTDMLLRVFGIRSIPALTSILSQQIRQDQVLRALDRLVKLDGCVDTMTQSLHMYEYLAKLSLADKDSPGLHIVAIRILRIVSNYGPKTGERVKKAFALAGITDAALISSICD
ncbi:ribose-5-phosphate isomerase, partial [Thraustotheca clavata]